jgi:anti-sigma regulatory factor (Ser/Thr protein kinase)
MTYLFETDTQASSVIDTEWARWRSPLVLSMFGARLGKRSPEIARVVIYELLANAVQHSHANLVVVAAHAQRPAGRGPRRPTEELTISVWDNGDSVTHALREQFDRSEPAPSSLVPNDTFLLESVGWTAVTDRYRAGWAPRVDAPDEEFLISSLYPSGPCPGNRSHRFEQYPAVSVTKQRQAYNLHALYRCVVDLFSGVLEIRTGSQLMTLGLGQKQNKRRFYNMRLQRIGGRPFRGNLFTIRIPLAHAQ